MRITLRYTLHDHVALHVHVTRSRRITRYVIRSCRITRYVTLRNTLHVAIRNGARAHEPAEVLRHERMARGERSVHLVSCPASCTGWRQFSLRFPLSYGGLAKDLSPRGIRIIQTVLREIGHGGGPMCALGRTLRSRLWHVTSCDVM